MWSRYPSHSWSSGRWGRTEFNSFDIKFPLVRESGRRGKWMLWFLSMGHKAASHCRGVDGCASRGWCGRWVTVAYVIKSVESNIKLEFNDPARRPPKNLQIRLPKFWGARELGVKGAVNCCPLSTLQPSFYSNSTWDIFHMIFSSICYSSTSCSESVLESIVLVAAWVIKFLSYKFLHCSCIKFFHSSVGYFLACFMYVV